MRSRRIPGNSSGSPKYTRWGPEKPKTHPISHPRIDRHSLPRNINKHFESFRIREHNFITPWIGALLRRDAGRAMWAGVSRSWLCGAEPLLSARRGQRASRQHLIRICQTKRVCTISRLANRFLGNSGTFNIRFSVVTSAFPQTLSITRSGQSEDKCKQMKQLSSCESIIVLFVHSGQSDDQRKHKYTRLSSEHASVL